MAINLEDDFDGVAPSDAQLGAVRFLAEQLMAAEAKEAELEGLLKSAAARCKALRETELPDAMLAVGLKSFKLTGGAEIVVEPFFKCSLAGKALAAALTWLKKTKQEGLISREVSVSFGKAEADRAKRLCAWLVEKGMKAELSEGVNTSSFKAALKEYKKDHPQEHIPFEELGVYMGREAKIIVPKK